eukprot:1654973-Amphidinium_carterae.1
MGAGRKGKGKTNQVAIVPGPPSLTPEEEWARDMRAAVPVAARQRAAPVLLPQFNVPVFTAHDMRGQRGVALVPKADLPKVVQTVGHSTAAVGILTTQPPWELLLPGYTAQQVWVELAVRTEDGMQLEIEGAPVTSMEAPM